MCACVGEKEETEGKQNDLDEEGKKDNVHRDKRDERSRTHEKNQVAVMARPYLKSRSFARPLEEVEGSRVQGTIKSWKDNGHPTHPPAQAPQPPREPKNKTRGVGGSVT